ncbi:hypothetical protein [Gordonia amicalis]|uniref:hypothetical protein n=1 Tax=Gordonia amicalis TaxID=89053 RepID=UPI0024B8FBA0|nr:hypothetical protein [Gordonia amicalis]MDJ0454080.1 hypothetical protein [Gordonia amicalis]MDV7077224.1 hypothetical protein [Gordonia amicalis]
MADPHYTQARSAWVLARAGRRPAARRRGERLAARARQVARYDAGAGDAAVAEVTTRSRFGRLAAERDEHRGRWTVLAALVEAGRLVVAGPAIALSWAIYGTWYRQVPAWGPLRWRTLAWATGGVVVAMLMVAGVAWLGGEIPWWGWWLLAQPVVGAGRAAWLAYAYGWEAVPTATAAARPTPIRVRLGDAPALPTTTTPTEPVAAPRIRAVRVRVPAPTTEKRTTK